MLHGVLPATQACFLNARTRAGFSPNPVPVVKVVAVKSMPPVGVYRSDSRVLYGQGSRSVADIGQKWRPPPTLDQISAGNCGALNDARSSVMPSVSGGDQFVGLGSIITFFADDVGIPCH